ncbi:MAG TPA: GNAT family N-acetyltransferase [Nitrosopumilaceae archaeon]|nr:GNAT family N-acetyltransferase [Nitrosopumilaceae archaeon]HSF28770.1 GNAT family N-acetyltransferase [Nitrosopumilaceae archaeon]
MSIVKSKLKIRNVTYEDIPKIVELQKVSFPFMAIEGMIWKPKSLESHLKIFPQGQFCADYDGKIVGSVSSLITKLEPEYREHTWREVCGDSGFANHNPKGDSLYGADVSTHPDYRKLGIATFLYDARKSLCIQLNLRRIIAGGRLFNYCEFVDKMSPDEYVRRVIEGEIDEPVLRFQIKNGFKFIKILSNYLKDIRSLNYATFIEWKNPYYKKVA